MFVHWIGNWFFDGIDKRLLLVGGIFIVNMSILASVMFQIPNQLYAKPLYSELPLFLIPQFVAFSLGFFIRMDSLYAHAILVFLFAVFAFYYSVLASIRSVSLSVWYWIFPILTLLVLLVLRGFVLETYPVIDPHDEPWLLSVAIGRLRTGNLAPSIMPLTEGYVSSGFYYLVSIWLDVVGVSFKNARFFIYLLTLITAVITAVAARELYDSQTAVWAITLILGAGMTVYASRVRHDIGFALVLSGALYTYGRGINTNHLHWHMIAGILIGIGGFFHANTIFYGPVLAIGLYLPRLINFRQPQIKLLPLAFFCAGGVIGVILVILFQILPQRAYFMAFQQDMLGYVGRTIQSYIAINLDQIRSINQISSLDFVLVIGALLTISIFRQHPFDTNLILILILWQLALGYGGQGAFPYLNVHRLPLLFLVIARAFVVLSNQLAPSKEIQHGHLVLLTSVFLFMSSSVLRIAVAHLAPPNPIVLEREEAVEWIYIHIPVESTIVSQQILYPYLWEYDFISPFAHNSMPRALDVQYPNDYVLWDAFGVEYFVIDRSFYTSERFDFPETKDYFESRRFETIYHTEHIEILQRMPES